MNNLSRRAMFAGIPAAAIGVGAVSPAVAAIASPDPVFAALAMHRSCEVEYGRTCVLTDEVAAEQDGRTITEADDVAFLSAETASREALEILLDTVPTTPAGARAFLIYVLNLDGYEFLPVAVELLLYRTAFLNAEKPREAGR